MADYTKDEYNQFRSDLKDSILDHVSANPGLRCIKIEEAMVKKHPEWVEKFGLIKSGKWTIVEQRVYDLMGSMRRKGEVLQIHKAYYPLGTDPTTIQAPPPKSRKTKKAPAKVEVAPEVEETPEVEVEVAPEVEVEETPEVVVEETPEVETSTGAVKEITSTLLPVDDTPEAVEETSQETLETQEVVEDSPEVEVAPEDDQEVLFEDDQENLDSPLSDDEEARYDLKALRNEFDPHKLTLKGGATGEFLVYRDKELRNWVVTQKNREDYLIVPVDVNPSRADFAKYAKIARDEFDNALNHKKGSNILIRALVSCKPSCQHTDDFAGFVEECGNPDCPTHIWKDNVIYVNPND